MQFLIRRVGRKKSQKLIKCAVRLFRTTEYLDGLEESSYFVLVDLGILTLKLSFVVSKRKYYEKIRKFRKKD